MAKRPNILLITTDQQRFDTLHAAGAGHMFTPHLNWLSDQGIRFDRCYSDAPLCIPARATLMTGRHGYSNKLTLNALDPVPMAVNPTMPGALTAAGYQTRAVGKMHFHPLRGHYGFEHMTLLDDYFRYMQKHPHLGVPKNHGVGENEMEPVFNTVDENHSMTRWLVDQAIDYFETADPLRPTFCWLSFPKPHPPYDCDRKYWELYDGIDLPAPVRGNWSQRVEDVPLSMLADTQRLNRVYRFSPQQLRNIRRAYYACITQIDYNLGYLFARLRELSLLENTWIIFTSDHGEMLGDHWLGAKSKFMEGSAHVPLLIRPPLGSWTDSAIAGSVRTDLACLADIMPTLLGIAGVSTPAGAQLDGRDLLAKDAAPREELIGVCGTRYGLYHGTWVYTFDLNGGTEMLFNLADDPYEQQELIRTGGGGDMLQQLRARLTQFVAQQRPEAVREGKLSAVSQPQTEQQSNGHRWPGFHSRSVPTDVLH